MQSENISPFDSRSPKAGVCIADGFGIRIFIRRRHLVVQDGLGRQRRERSFSRATAGIKRLVVFGHEGFVTLEALRWMADLGIAFIHLDRDGKLLGASAPPGNDDARLRRAQALARETDVRLDVARYLVDKKLKGQGKLLAGLGAHEAQSAVAAERRGLAQVQSTDELMSSPEARAAAVYWQAWTTLPIRFVRKDEARVPGHWKTFGARRSPLSGSPRLAANPANATLNYLYRLLEAETRLACIAVGLDPGLGFFHKDKRGRDNLVMDLMEACRPQVDAFALKLFQSQTFRAADFHETRTGVCRILAPLTHQLAETSLTWARMAAPVAEHIARKLGKPRRIRVERPPTPLTGMNRSRRRDGLRQASEPAVLPSVPWRRTCRECGASIASRTRTYCDPCLAQAGSGDTRLKRAAASARQQEALAEWRQWGYEKPDPRLFKREILPGLRRALLSRMMQATGLSEPYCSRIRRGEAVPHVRHWKALREVAETESDVTIS
jgi:CRISPR-associated endonuclease Cas1